MAGKQKLKDDSIGVLSKVSSITVELAPSTVTIGGLQYETGELQLSTNLTGAGGLDTGSIAANTAYYVYVILSSGSPAIICSLSNSAPSGFDISVRVGGFFTDNSGQIENFGIVENNELKKTVKFTQRKDLSTVATGSTLGPLPELTFNNLVIGRKYRIKYSLRLLGNFNVQNAIFSFNVSCGSFNETFWESFYTTNQGVENTLDKEITFVADAIFIQIALTNARSDTNQDSQAQVRTGTYAILEEVIDEEETTKWN